MLVVEKGSKFAAASQNFVVVGNPEIGSQVCRKDLVLKQVTESSPGSLVFAASAECLGIADSLLQLPAYHILRCLLKQSYYDGN